MYAFMCVYMYAYMCVCMYVSMYVGRHVYMYIYFCKILLRIKKTVPVYWSPE